MLTNKAVHRWVNNFSQGCSLIVDEVGCCRPFEIATDASVQLVEEMSRCDGRVTIDSALGFTWFSIQHNAGDISRMTQKLNGSENIV
jgi:hypothetical protein